MDLAHFVTLKTLGVTFYFEETISFYITSTIKIQPI